MSRFRPDGLGELLARTFEMADMRGGVYVETIAPDLRPAALAIALAIGLLCWASSRLRTPGADLQHQHGRDRVLVASLVAWLAAWVAWLGVSGHGRYALALLVLMGPLLGASLWRLPIRHDWRWLILCIVAAAQLVLLYSASPSNAWSMLRHRWTGFEPFASRDRLLAPLAPDLIISTQSQTMTALIANTATAQPARWLSLDFAEAMGPQSVEGRAALRAIAEAKKPILLDSYNTDFLDPMDVPKLLWRQRSQDLLGRYGLAVDATTCRRELSPLNVMQVACRLNRTAPTNPVRLLAAPEAENSMKRLIELCGTSLWPHGARAVERDGSLVQVFRETRYVIRAAPNGALYVRGRQDLNFQLGWGGPLVSAWKDITCDRIIRREVEKWPKWPS